MPGFKIGGTGQGPNHTIETRRKHRWSISTMGKGTGQFQSPVLLILKEATRPTFNFEEPEMHHNQEQAYFAGKQNWEPIRLVWYDGEQSPDVSAEIWDWLNTVSNIASVIVAPPNQYKKECTLQMENGAGVPTETWQMFGCWPQNINWNDLDYANTDIQTLECTMRYDRALRV